MPVMGRRPIFMPIFIKTCDIIIRNIPKIIRVEKRSGVDLAICKSLLKIIKYNTSIIEAPIRPNSSEIEAKIKSV